MVVMQNKCGQLGNRLIIFSHFIANAIHYDYQLFNPTFDEYSGFFPATARDDFAPCSVSVGGRGRLSAHAFERLTYLASKIAPRSPWHAFIRWRGMAPFDLNDPAFIELARRKTVLAIGWTFRDEPHLVEHGDIVRRFFTPHASILDPVRCLAASCRRSCDILVGVHIRRGDYRTKNSRYCFDDAVYRNQMEQAARLFAGTNRRVGFLVCGNEPVAASDFPGLAVFPGPGDALGDLYALAQCDFLIGPPSTFSQWASFYGRAPLCWIRSPDQTMTRAAFTCDLQDPV